VKPATVSSRPPARDGITSLLVRVGLANTGFAQALYLSLLVILPGRAASIGGAEKANALAVVAASGALVALLAGIVAGRVSDTLLAKTASRRTILVVGAVLGALMLTLLPFTHSLPSLLAVWCGAQIGLNGVLTVITAALVDWFGIDHRGTASAYAAVGQVLGALSASGVAFGMGSHLGGVGVISGLCFLLMALPAAHPPQSAVTRLPADGRAMPPSTRRSYRDVLLAWAVRTVVTFSNTLVITFISYYVIDVLGVPEPQRFVGLAAGLTSILVLVGAVYSGRASDRTQRRRSYVIGAVLVMGLGELMLGFWPHVSGTLLASSLVGLGYGIYLAVDQALTADVLPDPERYGRDIGIMNTSTAAPQVAAPAFAALLFGVTSSYQLLFLVGAAITLTGAAFVLPIRTVR
jgi:MFS family permease